MITDGKLWLLPDSEEVYRAASSINIDADDIEYGETMPEIILVKVYGFNSFDVTAKNVIKTSMIVHHIEYEKVVIEGHHFKYVYVMKEMKDRCLELLGLKELSDECISC